MKTKRLRELSDGLARDLNLDKAVTTETMCVRLCEVMAERIGRPITLRFDDLGDSGLSGLWAVTEDDIHVIIVTTARSWVHRLLILLHEVAHMLCGHEPMRLGADEGRRILFPDLSSRMLTVLAGRTNLSRSEEREADQVAGALARALLADAHERKQESLRPDGDDPVTRTWYTLGFSVDRDHD
jgi:hypothetical protein